MFSMSPTTGTDASNNCLVQSDPCVTISHAVSVAASGDTVEVASGTYVDVVVVNVPNLTITGQGPSTIVHKSIANEPMFKLNSDGISLTKMSMSAGMEGSNAGDAIDNSGNSTTIEDDTVTLFNGAGISNPGDNVTIRNDLIAGNSGDANTGEGGGIYNQGDNVIISNDTIANNGIVVHGGGALWNSGTGVLLIGDTITSNQSSFHYGGPGGIDSTGPAGSLTIVATIVSDNIGSSNCDGPITDAGYNLEWDGQPGPPETSCGFSAADHDVLDQDPNLQQSWAWNGGPTQTEAIGAGSPAQGAIPASAPFCTGTDQRGAPRPQSGSTACDMGAFQSIGGYWEVASDGGIFAFGAPFFGSMGGTHLNAPIVGTAEDPITGGYWEVASDGGVFAFNAPFDGSMGGQDLTAPIVGMATDAKDAGYWLVASDGGIFAFGGAGFLGSMGGRELNAPIVAMAADPTTGGYWLVASDGGIFSFDTMFSGSMGGQHLNAPMVGVATTMTGCGYWEVAADGGLFNFPTSGTCAPFLGSTGGQHLNAPVVGMAAPPNGQGYWEVAADGGIFAFGVPFRGSMGGTPLNAPIVGMATG
jgi:hypothetical protein